MHNTGNRGPVSGSFFLVISAIFLSGIIGFVYVVKPLTSSDLSTTEGRNNEHGVVLPISWGDIGKQMTEAGVIDGSAFEAVHARRGDWDVEAQRLLYGSQNDTVVMDGENAGVLLNLFWAFGLSNTNPVLASGPMMDPVYGGPHVFASTGGWTLARGDVMDHFNAHPWVELTEEQEELVHRVAGNIYRPCCNNPTSFPDCNHGMAMLGLIELMAREHVSEEEMYRVALEVNRYWFPGAYATIDAYLTQAGIATDKVSPQQILGKEFSSAQGLREIRATIQPLPQSDSGSCGV